MPGIVEADRGEAMRAIMIAVATAWLATAQPAAAKDVCNTLATPLTSAEIAELRNEAVRLMPLRYDEAARAVTIENASDNKGDIAPAAHANGHGGVSIVVPTRFRVLLCQLFLVHIYYLNGFHSPSELKTRMNECVTTRSASDCIFIVTSKIVGGRRAFDFSNDPSPFLKVTDEALFTILLHEYAHVVLKDFESIGPASETNADAFSLVYSLLGMKGDLGAVGAFYGLTFADAFFSESIHGSFACRAYIGNQIMSRLSNKISKIHAWGLLTLAKYRADQANPGPKEDVFGPVGETRLRELKCRGYDPRFVDQIEQDVDSILTVVDRPVSGQPEPFAYYEPIRNLTLATDVGRYLRQWLLAVRLRNYNADFRRTNDPPARYLAIVSDVLRDPEAQIMPSTSYGELLALRAGLQFQQDWIDGNPLAHANALRADLALSLHYNSIYVATYEIWISLELAGARDCAAARKVVRRGIVEAHPDSQLYFRTLDRIFEEELAAGPCTPASAWRILRRVQMAASS